MNEKISCPLDNDEHQKYCSIHENLKTLVEQGTPCPYQDECKALREDNERNRKYNLV